MTFGNDPPTRGTYVNTRYLDYWYWDYSSTEPFAGAFSNCARDSSTGRPLVIGNGVNVGTWTSSPFKTRPNVNGTITGFDLSCDLVIASVLAGPNNTYLGGFDSYGGAALFEPFVWGLASADQININSVGQVPVSPAFGQPYTITMQIRAAGSTYLLDGVDTGLSSVTTTADVPDWLNAKASFVAAESNKVLIGGHEFKVIVSI